MNFKPIIPIVLFLIFIAGLGQIPGMPKTITIPVPSITPSSTPIPAKKEVSLDSTFTVTRVIDGDTVELNTGEKLRYIGIDAPEKQNPKECFSGESTQGNKEIVLNKTVRLEKDKTNRDRYGRLLRYVYLQPEATGATEIFINEYLVRQGFAFSKAYRPDTAKQFILDGAQSDASASGRGIWSSCR